MRNKSTSTTIESSLLSATTVHNHTKAASTATIKSMFGNPPTPTTSNVTTPVSKLSTCTAGIVSETPQQHTTTKKQRSIHDFFSQKTNTTEHNNSDTKSTSSRMTTDSSGGSSSGSGDSGDRTTATTRKKRSLPDALEHESVKKRIDYETSSVEDEEEEQERVSFSQSSDMSITSFGRMPRPKRIDFSTTDGFCPSSQRSEEPDSEPSHILTPKDLRTSFTRQNSLFFNGRSSSSMYSQDEMDFCTPQDQPVLHLSHPTTPSPIKKRPRRIPPPLPIQESQEEVSTLANGMTHINVDPLPEEEEVEGDSIEFRTPKQHVIVPRTISHTTTAVNMDSIPSMDSFINPFAPVITMDSRKRRPNRKRQSFPLILPTRPPYSRYLTEFVEQELLGTGAFSKVYKCLKKLDGWIYAIKKSKRHFRGRADTERALREVQALAALSDSQHIIRYFDAWIEDDLLYIQLEYGQSCSLSSFIQQYYPHHIPEETLCILLSHLSQALYDLHGRKMVHMDVKIQNVLVFTTNSTTTIYKLGDLGTVAWSDGSMEITEGDNRYLSREMVEGNRSHLTASDVFALGASIYELACGTTLPSGGEDWQKIRDGDLQLFRQYSNAFQHLIANMMHPDPLQRPSAQEILQHEVVVRYRTM